MKRALQMSITDTKTVDIVSTNKDGLVVLTITDHLEWGDGEHLFTLQEKLNTYLAFAESGELIDKYPNAKGRNLLINVCCKFPPDKLGVEFLAKVKHIVESAGFAFQYELFAVSYHN